MSETLEQYKEEATALIEFVTERMKNKDNLDIARVTRLMENTAYKGLVSMIQAEFLDSINRLAGPAIALAHMNILMTMFDGHACIISCMLARDEQLEKMMQ
jgi:hypothetical protein